jgi:hypothetical protein
VSPIYYTTYLVLLIFLTLVVIGGYESTMRLVHYLDLQLRMGFIRIQMFFMRRRLKKQLINSFHKKNGGKNARNKNLP